MQCTLSLCVKLNELNSLSRISLHSTDWLHAVLFLYPYRDFNSYCIRCVCVCCSQTHIQVLSFAFCWSIDTVCRCLKHSSWSFRCVCNIDCSHISFNPVCASDGRSYDNPCQVKEASCQKQERIEVKYLGHCQGSTLTRKFIHTLMLKGNNSRGNGAEAEL